MPQRVDVCRQSMKTAIASTSHAKAGRSAASGTRPAANAPAMLPTTDAVGTRAATLKSSVTCPMEPANQDIELTAA